MGNKNKEYQLTKKILSEYHFSALKNARSLVSEAKVLFDNKFYARGYFLACASIEEVGKAFILHNAQGRNLNDGAVQNVIKNNIENHSSKITSAFFSWNFLDGIEKERLLTLIDLAINIKNGREPSMYVDISPESKTISPLDVVGEVNAKDIIDVATTCLEKTIEYTSTNSPQETSTFDDKFYCMSQSLRDKIMNSEDFSKYLLDNMTEHFNFAKTIVNYNESYYQKDKAYNKS